MKCTNALVHLCLLLVASVASAQTPNWPSERVPKALAAHEIKFPPYQIQTLPNGLQVVAVSQHEQPAVSLRLLVRTGSAADPKGKLGLARLVADLLDQGTTTKSAHEMNDEIDFIGGSMNAHATTDLTSMSVVVMKDSFEPGLRMLADMAEHPAFANEEVERQRHQMLSNLQVNGQDTENVANAVFDRLVYGQHPYGNPDSGTPETVAGLTRDDLVAFHRKYFAPNNAILAVVGDVTAEEAFAMAVKVFGDWAAHDVPKEKFVDPPDSTRRVVVINKTDAVQTEVRVGHLGVPRNHSDYMAINLAIRILGGEGANRLHRVLRSQRSLTYGAQADFDALKETGDFEATTSTRTEATGEVLRLIVDEFWRLQRERVSEAELAGAKAYMAGSFPMTIETPDAIATQVLNAVFYGLPLQQLQTFRERVNAVTVDDIERVSRYYLKPDRVSIVLVGNAAGFASQLRGLGFGRFETIDIDNLDLLAADFKRPARTARAGETGTATDVAQVSPAVRLAFFQTPAQQDPAKARALLDKVIAAKGGVAALSAVRTVTAVTSATMKSAGGNADTKTTYLQYPDRLRVEIQLPQGLQIQAYDRRRGGQPVVLRHISDIRFNAPIDPALFKRPVS